MKDATVKKTLLKVYLLSRFVINTTKKLNKEQTLVFSLLALIEEKPRTVRELADLYSVNHSFMSTVLSKMEKRGLVKKKIDKDQRFRKVMLAEKGEEARRAVSGEGYKLSDIFFKNMSDAEIAQLYKLLSKLNLDRKKIVLAADTDYTVLRKK